MPYDNRPPSLTKRGFQYTAGNRSRFAAAMKRVRWMRRNACGGTMKLPQGARAISPIWASISPSLRTRACCGSMSRSRAAPSIERHHCGDVGFIGSSNTATRLVSGAMAFNSSTNFPPAENSSNMKPVILPPGWDRLETNPCPTGSDTNAKTIGMLRVASRTIGNAGPVATITVGRSSTSSLA